VRSGSYTSTTDSAVSLWKAYCDWIKSMSMYAPKNVDWYHPT
jgi:hypothetical protein